MGKLLQKVSKLWLCSILIASFISPEYIACDGAVNGAYMAVILPLEKIATLKTA